MGETDNEFYSSATKRAEELLSANRFSEALSALGQLCQQNPRDYDVWLNLGVTNVRLRLFDAAEAAFKRALLLREHEPNPYINLVRLYDLQGRHDEAINCCQSYLQVKPDDARFYVQIGRLQHRLGRLSEAEWALREALRYSPDNAAFVSNLGIVLCDLGNYDEALKCYQTALRLNPRMDDVYFNMGYVHQKRDEINLAETNYQAALEINPRNSDVHKNLGTIFLNAGRSAEAMSCFEARLRLLPECAESHWNRALLWLAAGNFRDGWNEYEWRFKWSAFKSPYLNARYSSKERWDGAKLLGKTLLIYAEQGFGDTLQFCRYLPLVRQRVEHVVFECQPELHQLLDWSFEGIDLVKRHKGTLPETLYDLQIPLLSLPRVFETEINTIPMNVPYIHVDPVQVGHWRSRIDSCDLRVGLVWAGSQTHKLDQKRSLSLKAFAPFGRLQRICFYCLQKGPAAAEAGTPPSGMRLVDLAAELDDFATTAAVIANLDLVITIDTAVAHLAGAMGKPVWVLIYSPSDWRWLLDRDDTPWYPTMRLFRQAVPGEWGPVIERVAEALQIECNKRSVSSQKFI